MPKSGKKEGNTPTQSKLTNFGARSTRQLASKEANNMEATPVRSGDELTGAKKEILTAISGLKSEFSSRFNGILSAIEETRKDLSDCTERMTQAETHLSTVEDEQAGIHRHGAEAGEKE